MKNTSFHQTQAGFSLVEMSVVLAIVALLLGGLLPAISSQIEQQRRNETRNKLEEIKQALIGYAIINRALPCPTTATDPASASYGMADATCSANATADGYLPWKTLGVSETDAWGSKRNSTNSLWTGYWRYRVDRHFITPFDLNTGFGACPGATSDCLTIRDNSGNNLTTTTERPVVIVFSTGPNVTADGQNASTSYEAASGIYQSDVPSTSFDDILIWVSRPLLFNRMVAAGQLP